MRIEHVEGNEERTILTAMIVDTMSLARIATKWKEEMFRNRWANLVGGWCVQYLAKHGRAPSKDLNTIFESWARTFPDKDTVSLVERFLRDLSGEWAQLQREINTSYVLDVAQRHFTRVALQRMTDIVTGEIENGKLDLAVKAVSDFGRVELGSGSAINVLENKEALIAALEEDAEDLITYPGALGAFFRGQLQRDSFVVFMAPEKRGKSFWLIDIGWRSILQRRKVAWFAAGDMSERQMLRRFAVRGAAHPHRAKTWPCVVQYPTKMRRREDGLIQVKFEERTFDAPLDWRKAAKAFEEIAQYRVRGREYLRLSVHPTKTLSVKGIDTQLQIWEREGWVPDVVVGDYADIYDDMVPGMSTASPRDRINYSWEQQRALSQKWHILYVTATQADADSYTQELIRRSNFSEDKRKLAHVTGMVGINQNHAEKQIGAYRLNWVALREGEYSEDQTVCTASCLAMSNPAVRSCF